MKIEQYRLGRVGYLGVPFLRISVAARQLVFRQERKEAEFTLRSTDGVRQTLRVRTSELRTSSVTPTPGEWR